MQEMAFYNNNFKMEYLYRLAIQEGEGLGTAYEYFSRLRLLKRLLNNKKIKKVLIAGLPEKYGFGLDLLVFAGILDCNVYIVDDRKQALDALINNISILQNKKLLNIKKVEFEHVDRLDKIEHPGNFDLAVSSSVIQRLSSNSRKRYSQSI